MRTKEQNEIIARAVGRFIDSCGKKMSDKRIDPFAREEILEKDLLEFMAGVTDDANARVARATTALRDQFAGAALTGLAGELHVNEESTPVDTQVKEAKQIARAAWLLAEAMMDERPRVPPEEKR